VSVVPRYDEDGKADVGTTFRNLASILETTGATDVFVPHAAFRPGYAGDDEELFIALVEMFDSAIAGS
jgi:hypothetical protein